MSETKRVPSTSPRVLATDLDGTLIPLADVPHNAVDLQTLCEKLRAHRVKLVFVTGRHYASVRRAIDEHQLPTPDWIICDVGTSIYERRDVNEFIQLPAYGEHLAAITAGVPIHQLRALLAVIKDLRPQETEKQGPFKLSYYTNENELAALQAEIVRLLAAYDAPYSVVHSVDPFNRDGLIDLLPRGVSKAYALDWWSGHADVSREDIVYAGDSGNDLAVLLAGYRTIIVGNADRSLSEQVLEAHRKAGWRDRLFVASEHATSGVLAGCRKFGLIDHLGAKGSEESFNP